jgi:hypothetical protein
MKKIIVVFISIFFLSSCDSESYTDEKELPLKDSYNVIVIDGCEYLQYKSTLYCGHQYTHHTYAANFLTHKGNCKNHPSK